MRVLSSSDEAVRLRVKPRAGGNGDLAGAISAKLTGTGTVTRELHTEPGRLDEVFHALTQSETSAKENQ